MIPSHSSIWSRTKVSTLSNLLLVMMLITGIFFTSAFAYVGNAIDDISELWQTVQSQSIANQTVSQALSKEIQTLQETNIVLLGFVPIAAGFFFILMYATLIHKIVRPLKDLEQGIVDITSRNDFHLRIEEKHHDEIGIVIQRFNVLVDSLEKNFDSFSHALEKVSNGDFSQRCRLKARGDLEKIKDRLNSTFDSVEVTMTSLQDVAHGIANGDFSVRVDERVKGTTRDKVDHAMNCMSTIINEISQLMQQLNQGDFSGQIHCEAYGQMADLKQHINESISHIAMAIHSFSEVVAAQASGDLTKELPKERFKGQLFDLSEAINYSIFKLNEVVEMVIDTSESVNLSSDKVAQGSSEINLQMQEQAKTVDKSISTIEDLNRSVQTNVSNAQMTTHEANSVTQKAQQGLQVMQKTIEAMQRIQESSKQIAEIVTLIDSIAFQTNLLALNAAVEAARAGEHGRGFAVVAGEVRNLAQKSADAAHDIKQLIESSVSRIDQGTELVSQSGTALADINHSIEEISGQIAKISVASEQQGHGVIQVQEVINMVNHSTNTNSQMISETQNESKELHKLAKNLREYITFFTIRRQEEKTGTNVLPPPARNKT